MKLTPQETSTNDMTLEDEYEVQRLESLPPHLRELAAKHVVDQFEAVPSYAERWVRQEEDPS